MRMPQQRARGWRQVLERGLHWRSEMGLCQVPQRDLQGLHQLLGLDWHQLLEVGLRQLLERGLIQVQERDLRQLQQELGLPEAQLAPPSSGHMSSGSSRRQAHLC